MKKLIILLIALILVSTPAFADDYEDGYYDGLYYGTPETYFDEEERDLDTDPGCYWEGYFRGREERQERERALDYELEYHPPEMPIY